MKASPGFGIKNAKAGFQPPSQPAPDGTTIVGPIKDRNGKAHVLYGPKSKKWSDLANNALLEIGKLNEELLAAQQEVKQREKEVPPAEKALNDAQKAFDDAFSEKSRQDAHNKAEEILRELKRSCAGQTITSKLDGCELEVYPGVLPEDEKRVTDVLTNLEEKELRNLKKVKLTDACGPPHAYIDNDGKVVATRAIGKYWWPTKTITGYVGDYEPENIKHEVGHHIFNELLDDKARIEWREFWRKADNRLKVPKGKMPTQYAGFTHQEAFSEVYWHFKENKPLDPEARDLMQKLLGGIPDAN